MPEVKDVLEYGTDEHNKLLSKIKSCINMGESSLSGRRAIWETIDDYMEEERYFANQQKDEDLIKEAEERLELPKMGTAKTNVETFSAFIHNGLTQESPPVKVKPRKGEDYYKAYIHQALVEYQFSKNRIKNTIQKWIKDATRYGLGVVRVYWEKEQRTLTKEKPKTKVKIEQRELPNGEVVEEGVMKPTGETEKREETITIYEGNKIENIDPYKFGWDTRRAADNLQDGTFVYFKFKAHYMDWREKEIDGQYFNIEDNKVRFTKRFQERLSKADEKSDIKTSDISLEDEKGFQNGVEVYVKLRPEKYGLKSEADASGKRQMWRFIVANQDIIIWAEPVDNYLQRFPVALFEYEADTQTTVSRALPEKIIPMEDQINWGLKTFVFAKRLQGNGRLIVDDRYFDIEEIKKNEPGYIITPDTDIPPNYNMNNAWSSLGVPDVSQSIMQFVGVMRQFIRLKTGISENMLARPLDETKSATEVANIQKASTNRQQLKGKLMAEKGLKELGEQMTVNNWQYLNGRQVVRIVGDEEEYKAALKDWLKKDMMDKGFLEFNAGDIVGFFDIKVIEGMSAPPKTASIQALSNIAQQIFSNPELAKRYNPDELIKVLANLMEVPVDLDNFKREQSAQGGMMGKQGQPGQVPPGPGQGKPPAGGTAQVGGGPQPAGQGG